MKNNEIKNEFIDLQTYINLGIKNYSEKQLSYSKWFNNNHHLAYDNHSIYLVDKLHMTFISDYTSSHFNQLKNPKINYENNYDLEKFISLKKANSRRVDFRNNYLIVVSGITYGNMLFDHSNVSSRVQIELSNQFLYTNSSYDLVDNLNKIAQSLKLTFDNVSKYDLARDGTSNLYKKYSIFHWLSDACPVENHEAHNSKPTYSYFGKLAYNPIITSAKDKTSGTAYIGSAKSAHQIKIYSKTKEINNSVKRKSYISKVHKKHFGTADNIVRVEASITSAKVNRLGLDLFDLLNPEMHIDLFYHLTDSRLTFKNLESRTWDKNKNAKYELVKILPERNTRSSVKEVVIQSQPERIHSNNRDKFKIMVHSFLDEEVNCFAIHGFIKTTLWENDITIDNSENIIMKIYNRYQNPIDQKVKNKQKFIRYLIKANGNKYMIAKAYCYYLFSSLMFMK